MRFLIACVLLVPQLGIAGYTKVRSVTVLHGQVGGSNLTNFPIMFTTVFPGALNSSPNNSTTSITVTAGGGNNIQNNDYIKIDSEIMLVTAGGGTTTLTVTRGQKSTSAASHTTGAAITNMFLANSSNGNGDVTSASGYDIQPSTSSTCASFLSFERPVYSGTSGVIEIWTVAFGTLSASVDNVFYLCYSNSSVTTDQQSASAPWTTEGHYNTVYHGGDGTTLSTTDSTTNANNATNHGATAGAGIIAGGIATTTTNYMNVLGAPSGTANRTISFWIQESMSGVTEAAMFDMGDINSTGDRLIIYQNSSNTLTIDFFGSSVTGGDVHDGKWHLISIQVPSSTEVDLWVDGVNQYNSTGKTINTVASPQLISKAVNSGTVGTNGTFDEIHFSTALRGTGWNLCEYNNGFSPQTFYTTAAPVTIGGAAKGFSNIL